DRWAASPGFIWSETLTGTTGVALALETRSLAHVSGKESYIIPHRWAQDISVPVAHPITGRIEGVLHFAWPDAVDGRHMNIVLRHALRGIRDRLYETATVHERLLLQRFNEACRSRSRAGVIVLSERLMLSNHFAATLLKGTDSLSIWEHASEAV